MEKITPTQHEVLDIIKKRWSPVIYSDKPVERNKLLSMLEAARWAPSSYNEQPWSFLVALKEDQEEYKKMLDCLVPGNLEWAQMCPVLMITVAKRQFDANQKDNRHWFHDVGMATQNLMLQAASLGLYAHGMAGFDVEKTRQAYGIPDTHEPVAALGIGYPGEHEGKHEKLVSRDKEPRERDPLKNFVFQKKWNNPADFLS